MRSRNPENRRQFGTVGEAAPQGTSADTDTARTRLSPPETENELESLFDSVAGASAGRVEIRKWGRGERGVEGWLRCCTIQVSTSADFDPEQIADRWGRPGLYHFTLKDDRGRVMRQAQEFFAAPTAPLSSTPPNPQPAALPSASFALGGESSILALILKKDDEHRQYLQQFNLTLLQGLLGNRDGGVKVSDLVEVFRAGRDGGGAPSGGNVDAIQAAGDLITKGIDLGRGLPTGAAASEEGDGMGGIASLAAPLVTLLTRWAAAPAAAPASASAALPQTQPAAALPSPTRVPAEAQNAIDALLPKLIKAAAENRNGYTFGRYWAERIPEAFLPQLLDLVQLPSEQRHALLCSVAPQLSAHRAWLDDVADGLREELLGEDEETAQTREEVIDATARASDVVPSVVPSERRNGNASHGAGDGGAHPARRSRSTRARRRGDGDAGLSPEG